MKRQVILAIIVIVCLLAVPVTLLFTMGNLFPESEKTTPITVVIDAESFYDEFNCQIIIGLNLVKDREQDLVDLSFYHLQPNTSIQTIAADLREKNPKIVVLAQSLLSGKDILTLALLTPDIIYVTVDFPFLSEELPQNIVNIVFRSEEASLVAGYLAGTMSSSSNLGFLGGKDDAAIDRFLYGFKAGVDLAGTESGKSLGVLTRTVGSYANPVRGNELAKELYDSGCTIGFMVAGASGFGGIKAAEELDKYAIGVDVDESYIAPRHVIFSVLKNISGKVSETIVNIVDGKEIPRNQTYGFAENGLEISMPSSGSIIPAENWVVGVALISMIKEGLFVVPSTAQTYVTFNPKTVLESCNVYIQQKDPQKVDPYGWIGWITNV